MKQQTSASEKLQNIISFIRACNGWHKIIYDYLRLYVGLRNSGYRTLKFRNGIRLKVPRKSLSEPGDNGLMASIWFSRVCNPPGFEIERVDTIIDIGAHNGSFSDFAAFQTGEKGYVYSFKSFPATLAILEENIYINSLKNINTFILGCVGKRKEKLYIFQPQVHIAHFPKGGKFME